MTINHIAFIMDGNRRFGKKNLINLKTAYKKGIDNFLEIIQNQIENEIKHTSFFALSCDNYEKRPLGELIPIIKLLKEFSQNESIKEFFSENNIKIEIKGNLDKIKENKRFEKEDQDFIENIDSILNDFTKEISEPKFFVHIAINYDGQEEIVSAFNKLISQGKTEITQKDIKENIYFNNVEAPEIIVRPGDAPRLSGFLLWDSQYSEIYLTKKLWPELNKEDFVEILNWFNKTKRNFGK